MLLLGKNGDALCPGLASRVPEDLDIRRAVAAAASASFAALTTDSLLSGTKRDSSARERDRQREREIERERDR